MIKHSFIHNQKINTAFQSQAHKINITIWYEETLEHLRLFTSRPCKRFYLNESEYYMKHYMACKYHAVNAFRAYTSKAQCMINLSI
jgi:hypothetical protein